jgi:hypothetical protein
MSVKRFAVMLAIVAALAAAPVVVARAMSATRISTAARDASRLAVVLVRSGESQGIRALVGDGQRPVDGTKTGWFFGPSASLDHELALKHVALPTSDPWRHAFLVNVGAAGPHWILSAGANGIIETPFDGADAPEGDDVTALIR